MQPSRLKVGVDVPWVTSWTEETMLGAAPCMTVPGMMAAAQAHRPGFGRPVYSQNHFIRQRMSVRRMQCPMCGEPTAEGDRWTLTARRLSAGALRGKGMAAPSPRDLADNQIVIDAGSVAPRSTMPALSSPWSNARISAPSRTSICGHSPPDGSSRPCSPPVPAAPVVMISATRPPQLVCFLQLCGVTDEVEQARL